MPIRASIFFSYPTPWATEQEEIIARVCAYLEQRGFEPRTLGVTDYDMDAPLHAVRRLMLECNGLVTIALRRTHVIEGVKKHPSETDASIDVSLDDRWLTTPWPHIEAAMAFQLGLPILVFREQGVVADGVLEQGVVGTYMPEIPSGNMGDYFSSPQWTQPMGQWEGRVRRVIEQKGRPPTLY